FVIFGGPGSTTDAYYVQFGGTLRGSDGMNIGPTSVPAFGAKQRHQDGWAQFTTAKYLPANVLNETTVSGAGSTDRGDPYLDLPTARVIVGSTLSDGSSGITSVNVGGSSQARNDSRTWSSGVRNVTSWNTWDRRHSLALTLDGNVDGYWYHQDGGFGTFTFNSLADFAS